VCCQAKEDLEAEVGDLEQQIQDLSFFLRTQEAVKVGHGLNPLFLLAASELVSYEAMGVCIDLPCFF
jgi:hypothetical protein